MGSGKENEPRESSHHDEQDVEGSGTPGQEGHQRVRKTRGSVPSPDGGAGGETEMAFYEGIDKVSRASLGAVLDSAPGFRQDLQVSGLQAPSSGIER